MKQLILVFITILILNSQFTSDSYISEDVLFSENATNYNTSSIKIDAIPFIIHDGIISSGEYDYSHSYDNGKYQLYYTINRSTIYFAIKAQDLGWVGIGFEYTKDMLDSDMILGWYDATFQTTQIFDTWGYGAKLTPSPDAINNILSSAASETSTATILEFSRLLETGDTEQDNIIIPGVNTQIIWAYHDQDSYLEHKKAGKVNSFTFYGPPAAPKNLTATSDKDKVNLNWIAPTGDGGSAITQYNIYRSLNGGSFSIINTTASTSYTDYSVITGENYTYKITAENANGESGDTNEVEIIPIGVITEPRNLLGSASSWQVDLSWTTPLDDGGLPISQYNVYRSDVSGGPYTLIGTNTSQTNYIDTDVINGFDYYYVVTAQNRLVTSGFSNETNASPIGPPTPPQNLVAIAGDNSVILSWTTPLSDGGYPLMNYKVYRSDTQGGPYSLKGTTNSTPEFLDNTTINSKTYYYVITANNSFGESFYSSEQRVTLAFVPEVPFNISISTGDKQVDLRWEKPDGKGFNVSTYTIYRTTEIGEQYAVIATTNTTSFTDISVINGQKYYYVVTASTSVGESSYSTQVSGTPASIPSIPLNVTAIGEDDLIKLSWIEPEDNGGYFVSYYIIYRSTSSGTGYVKMAISYPREYLDTKIDYGVSYYYVVTAVNLLGESDYSEEVTTSTGTVPLAPKNPKAIFKDQRVDLSWAEPEENGGSDITEYRVYRSTVSGEPYVLINATTNYLYHDASIIQGVTYYYVITAVNIYGESAYSVEITVVPISKPSTPEGLIGLAGNNEVLLSWLPSDDGGSPIIHYNIYRSKVEGTSYTLIDSVLSVLFTDNDVINNQTYFYVISAVNSFGESNFSNQVEVMPIDSAPSIEFNFNATDFDDFTSINNITDSEIIDVGGLSLDQIVNTSLSMVTISYFVGLFIIYKRMRK